MPVKLVLKAMLLHPRHFINGRGQPVQLLCGSGRLPLDIMFQQAHIG
jgi:hypothetical protein